MADLHDSPSPDPTLESAIDARLRGFALDLQVCCPAHVLAYAGGRADVQLGRLPVRMGATTPEAPIVIPGCPVAWPGNGSTASQTWDLLPGSIGLVHFADRALDRWLEQGAPCDPVSGQAHGLAGAIYSPHVPTGAGAATPGAMVLEATAIMLGANAMQPAARGTDLATALNAYATSITAAAGTLSGAAATWGGIFPNTLISNGAFATAFGAWVTTVTTAQATLATQIAAALSAKVRVE
jgi:hypothetical protein